MDSLSYDFHIHSCLSPCGDNDMTPANIVGMAALKGLNAIALTDHNSCKNCPAFMNLAKEYSIIGVPGMELTTVEEVHVVCLFPSLEQAMNFDAYVEAQLIPVKNKAAIFGNQWIVDEEENIIGSFDNLLINSTRISFDEVFDLTAQYGGAMIPAHIDKTANSLISNLGFVPPNSQFHTFELKSMSNLHALQKSNPYLTNCNVITSSDAHYLGDMNEPSNIIYVKDKSLKAIIEKLR